MLINDLSKIDESYLLQLCADACPESESLDWKRLPPEKSEEGKQEFLKDICAFSNGIGGDIVYGVSESAGGASALFPITSEAPDAITRRLLQVLDGGLEPRVRGIQLRTVNITGGYILIVRIPASLDGPHCFRINKDGRRFVIRNHTMTTDFSYDQLRTAFDRTATYAEKARHFVDGRIELLRQGKTWKRILAGPLCVAEVLPISAMSGRANIDTGAMYNNYSMLMFPDWNGASRALNLDGIVAYPNTGDDKQIAYTQLHRNGCFEAIRYGGNLINQEGRKVIPSTVVTAFYRNAIAKALNVAGVCKLVGPAVVKCALLKVDGYEFAIDRRFLQLDQAFADRTDILLPDVWIESMESVQDVDQIVRPMVDILWQAFGLTRCYEYDDTGKWIRPD